MLGLLFAAAMMGGSPSDQISEPPDPERQKRNQREAALARLMAPNAHGQRYTREAAEAILDRQGPGVAMVGAPDASGQPVPLPPLPGPPSNPTPEALDAWRAALVLALWSPEPPHQRPAWCTSPEVARRVADGAVEQLMALRGRASPSTVPSAKQIAARERQARRNARRATRD